VNLPGYSGNDTMFAGYLNVDPVNNRNLFYWLVESRANPDTAPLVLWQNGGPGCSSLGGMITELGPFFMDPSNTGQSVVNNPYSWVNVANVIFLESPAGVGFSFSDDTDDYTVGDARTSRDVYVAMTGFLDRYPQYRGRPFYVTGESYVEASATLPPLVGQGLVVASAVPRAHPPRPPPPRVMFLGTGGTMFLTTLRTLSSRRSRGTTPSRRASTCRALPSATRGRSQR